MASLNSTFISNLYQGLLLKPISSQKLTTFTQQLDTGFTTPVLLTLSFAQDQEFSDVSLPLATMYNMVFNTFATSKEMLFWRQIKDNGASLNDIASYFVNSTAFYDRFPTAVLSTRDKLNAIIEASEVSISTSLVQQTLSLLNNGTIGWGTVVSYLANTSDKHLNAGLALLWNSIRSEIPTEKDLLALGTNPSDAVSNFFTRFGINGNYIPTNENDTLTGTDTADTIQSLSGNDIITTGKGADTIIFEATATLNGRDTITDFKIGTGGDVLNFTPFLNKTNDLNMTSVSYLSVDEKVWKNGDVLVVTGHALTSPEAIAGLFGTGKVFAAPIESSKAVILSADVVGDTSIWYVVNQTNITQIDPTEITLVGTLKNVNNLGLVGFDVSNIT